MKKIVYFMTIFTVLFGINFVSLQVSNVKTQNNNIASSVVEKTDIAMGMEDVGNYPLILANNDNCSIFGDMLSQGGILRKIINIVQVLVVIGAIVLGMVDFAGAASSGEADSMKKATKRFTNRLIIAVLIVILPVLIDFIIVNFMNGYGDSCVKSL